MIEYLLNQKKAIIIAATGQYGVGKTTFALGGLDPSKVAFFNSDVKEIGVEEGDGSSDEMSKIFKRYYNIVKLVCGETSVKSYEIISQLIDDLPGNLDAIVFDTYSLFEKSILNHVKDNRNKYLEQGYTARLTGAMEVVAARKLESEILDKMAGKAKLVILTSQLKNLFIDQKNTGKLIPDLQQPIYQHATIRLMLVKGVNDAPDALVMKPASKMLVVEKDGKRVMRGVKTMPDKIEAITLDKLGDYWNNPLSFRDNENNVPLSDTEEAFISPQLNPFDIERINAIRLAAETEMRNEDRQIRKNILELKNQNKTVPQISREMNIPLIEVQEFLDGKRGL